MFKDDTMTAVAEFHAAFDIKDPKVPTVSPNRQVASSLKELAEMQAEVAKWAHMAAEHNGKDVYLLRVHLMAEELGEVIAAMAEGNPVNTLHELSDLRYVANGTALQLGMGRALVPATLEIHRANMSKLGADGKPVKDRAGRVHKGPNFKKADVTEILKVYGQEWRETEPGVKWEHHSGWFVALMPISKRWLVSDPKRFRLDRDFPTAEKAMKAAEKIINA